MKMSSKNIKAGRLLSKFIRQIAEETEFVLGKGGDDDRMVSKAELLARKMWRIALGYEEVVITDDGEKKITHAPDLKMAAVIMDRLEGRCGTVQEDEVTRPTTSNKVTEQGKLRISAIGRLDDDTGNA
jgi:hypothetical protein